MLHATYYKTNHTNYCNNKKILIYFMELKRIIAPSKKLNSLKKERMKILPRWLVFRYYSNKNGKEK